MWSPYYGSGHTQTLDFGILTRAVYQAKIIKEKKIDRVGLVNKHRKKCKKLHQEHKKVIIEYLSIILILYYSFL